MNHERHAAARHAAYLGRRWQAVAAMPPRALRPGPIRQPARRQAPMWSRVPRRGPMAWRGERGER